MPNFAQGIFTPKFPAKYIGNHKPKYRSGWEMTMMMFLDNNPSILQWASEPIFIPYIHPLTGKKANYIPDFLVIYENKYKQRIAEIVEIKPKKQSLIESKASAKDRAVVAINHAKWAACSAFCKKNGMTFRLITESELFRNGKSNTKSER
jgi:hypothetical protein